MAIKKYDYLFKVKSKVALGEKIKFIKGKQANLVSSIEGIPYLTIEDLVSGKHAHYCLEGIFCDEKDVLMVMDGASSGKVFTGNSGCVGSTLAKLVLPQIRRSVLYFGLLKFENDIMKNTTGSAIPHADKSFVRDLQVIDDEDEQMYKFFDVCLDEISNLKKQILILKKQKDILLQKYFD